MDNNKLKNDIIALSYYANNYGWKNISKTNYHRILYFSSALSPIFIPYAKWSYSFNNTIFGPYNTDITYALKELHVKKYLYEVERKIYKDKTYIDYAISKTGIIFFENILLKVNSEVAKYQWFRIIVKVLNIYGSDFLVKLIKNDPNVVYHDEYHLQGKLNTDNSNENLTKEFFEYLKTNSLAIDNEFANEDILLVFFDILYRKYKGGEL